MGSTGGEIVGETFRRVRDADRFWYEWAYPAEDKTEIESTTFRDVILRNTKLTNLPQDCFKIENQQTTQALIDRDSIRKSI